MSEPVGGEQLVVTSQTCDVIKPPDKEPFIDAVRAYVAKQKPNKNSPRYFLLNPDTMLVADAAFHVQLDKEMLLGDSPKPGLSEDPRIQEWFSVWLSNRFIREAFADEVVEAVIRPFKAAIRAFQKSKDPDVQSVLQLCELRILDLQPSASYAVDLVVLTAEPLEGAEELALGRVVDGMRAALVGKTATLQSVNVRTYGDISHADYLATSEIDIDDVTYAGELAELSPKAGEPG
jgi:hypothetical protein